MRFTCMLLLALATTVAGRKCRRGRSCWPTDSEVAAFRAALNPEMNRTIENVAGEPWVAPFPTPIEGFPALQPLYGLGLEQMEPLYVKPDTTTETCIANGTFASDFCKAQITGEPQQTEDADFVVFVLTVEHIRTALQFARRHGLCISVTGTGHDLMGRNQPSYCTGGSILIRTTLMQSVEADLEDEAGLGSPSFRFGAGVGFSTAQAFASDHGYVLASGWCETVGVVGYTLGGGNGPLAPRYGFGADNLLAADVMLADGTVVTAKASGKYSDLYTALRGGGGSTWGIITSVTVKAHPTPEDGFVAIGAIAVGSLCNITDLRTLEQDWIDLQKTFNEKQVAQAVTITSYPDLEDCSTSSFRMILSMIISANITSAEAQQVIAFFAARPSYIVSQAVPYATYSEAGRFFSLFLGGDGLIRINSEPRAVPQASALVQREDTDAVVDYIVSVAESTSFSAQFISSCLLGQHGAYESTGTRLSKAMRTALFHYLILESGVDHQAELRKTFGTEVYFAEASPEITDIRKAYWGTWSYIKLLITKLKYDPTRVFGCLNCI